MTDEKIYSDVIAKEAFPLVTNSFTVEATINRTDGETTVLVRAEKTVPVASKDDQK